MKKILKLFLKYYLKYITKIVLLIHRPTIIAVAGSTNKTFFKDEIGRQLRQAGVAVRSNPRSFNTEIGLPLAILDLPSGFNSYADWLPITGQAAKKIFSVNFPKYLILELGVSDQGDMKYLLSLIKPRVAVITDITQRYLEGFSDMDELVGEYELLVKKTGERGLVILNNDNSRVAELAKLTRARVITFGLAAEADWQAERTEKTADGEKFIIRHGRENKEMKINRFGQHHLYATLAGLIIKNYVIKEEKKIQTA